MVPNWGDRVKRFVLSALLALAACDSAPEPRHHPALWEVTAPDGAKGWVFGTVHALPDGLEWQTPAINRAVAQSGTLVLEIVDPANESAARAAFLRLGTTPGQPPLEDRIDPGQRPRAARGAGQNAPPARAVRQPRRLGRGADAVVRARGQQRLRPG